jgi:cell wall-associated NlpC family hydrolase
MADAEGYDITPGDVALPRRRAIALLGAAPLAAVAVLRGGCGAEAAKQSRKNGKKDRKGKGKGKNKGKGKKQNASGSAADVVQTAKKHKGATYVWGGASPKGFDCSGFTWYCFQKAAGMDIGRTEEEQWKRGNSVGKGDLKPGDLVFFKNTFERGLSHVGISLGGARFIHAENEGTGVVISNLGSGYYDDHYAGGRRLL